MAEPERPSIKAIETRYAGCRFRSRLEARWAVFFDELAIPWEYEPQGWFIDGAPYLPDFWLPHQNLYYEVKGTKPLPGYRERLVDLASGGKRRVVMACGDIPRPGTFYPAGSEDGAQFFMDVVYPDGSVDECHAWGRCEKCGATDVAYKGRIICGCAQPAPVDAEVDGWPEVRRPPDWQGNQPEVVVPDYRHGAWNGGILHAYKVARSARFEHGEAG